jgi:hypothetical protein
MPGAGRKDAQHFAAEEMTITAGQRAGSASGWLKEKNDGTR